ncbi:hypothetical protein [Paenibacillus sp.]|jgi:hypothetical protein|uniref:hypothetical protein n=1 Tax=Paenibacillus sp. TaxID=58172 RepID=UPI00282C09A3|nr:hypothetical protein [Paenibacillus sp.]MDR0268671.1 hypothetical protein [Paenibacillus sp.]
MKKRRNLLIVVVCTLFLIGSGIIAWPFVEDAMDKGQASNPRYRKLNEAERQELLDTVDAIQSKYGTFKRTTTEQPLPDDGVVYDIQDINKDTKVVFKDGRRFDRVPDGSKF